MVVGAGTVAGAAGVGVDPGADCGACVGAACVAAGCAAGSEAGAGAVCAASVAGDGAGDCAACCAAALIDASRAAVRIQFQVRITLSPVKPMFRNAISNLFLLRTKLPEQLRQIPSTPTEIPRAQLPLNPPAVQIGRAHV